MKFQEAVKMLNDNECDAIRYRGTSGELGKWALKLFKPPNTETLVVSIYDLNDDDSCQDTPKENYRLTPAQYISDNWVPVNFQPATWIEIKPKKRKKTKAKFELKAD